MQFRDPQNGQIDPQASTEELPAVYGAPVGIPPIGARAAWEGMRLFIWILAYPPNPMPPGQPPPPPPPPPQPDNEGRVAMQTFVSACLALGYGPNGVPPA
jgi:hypothetical protein